jgi:hypothetical protein
MYYALLKLYFSSRYLNLPLCISLFVLDGSPLNFARVGYKLVEPQLVSIQDGCAIALSSTKNITHEVKAL